MQVGMSRKTVLKEMHPDANNQYEMSMSLWDVCRDCCDPQKRLLRQVSGPLPYREALHFSRLAPLILLCCSAQT